MMTKQRIEQYTSLKREIAMLEDQIYKAECSGEFVTDSVKASSHEIPYAMHNVIIKGYATCHVPKLRKRKTSLEAECTAIENYIDAVEDSIMRQLLTRRYIEGKSLAEASHWVGYSESQTKRLYKNFFKKMAPDGP